VIDEIEGDLDRVGDESRRKSGGGQLALCLAHPVNRLFLNAAPAADAVLALDPLTRYAHNSRVAAQNLAYILEKLGARMALVVAPPGRRAATEQMLKHAYSEVTALPGSWLGGEPAIVVGRK
jgi:hypothetical protein